MYNILIMPEFIQLFEYFLF